MRSDVVILGGGLAGRPSRAGQLRELAQRQQDVEGHACGNALPHRVFFRDFNQHAAGLVPRRENAPFAPGSRAVGKARIQTGQPDTGCVG